MKYFAALCTVFILFSSPRAEQGNDSLLTIHFFGSSTCGECMEIKQNLLFPLKDKHPELQLRTHEIDTDEGFELLIKMESEYNVMESSPQILFFPDTFFTGYDDIMKLGKKKILDCLEECRSSRKGTSARDSVDIAGYLRDKTRGWGFFIGTLIAGLADGVNPCAIATMIFLISFLATQKRKRSEVMTIGLAYTVAVYVTYFAMGAGLKGIIEPLQQNSIGKIIIRWGAFVIAAGVALFSFRDAVVYSRTGKARDIKLQLPKAVKVRIHKIISGNLSSRGLIFGSIVAGFLVTLLEAICTGQMYLPYIAAMTRQQEFRIKGYIYLAFYNFLFVLPLLIVMIFAYYGLKWSDLAKKTQKNMVLLKILLGLVMTGLAVYLAVNG
ncbi:MAG: hypothetical protein GF350_15840 [Chitinivibrionales bacterium]|nr:hypothetical protein [Chitinivibrionales bacterium]